ncbi:MAG: hypothetical protein RMK84_07660 [Oscillochloridaceae bacterium]|nr:hypothetical protein [Chloroflexaceae bacterium]MDW8389986.1 hypothetical protein [Oscillochloridaceae bacterium]
MSRWPADIPDGAPVMLDASILVYAFIASRRVANGLGAGQRRADCRGKLRKHITLLAPMIQALSASPPTMTKLPSHCCAARRRRSSGHFYHAVL